MLHPTRPLVHVVVALLATAGFAVTAAIPTDATPSAAASVHSQTDVIVRARPGQADAAAAAVERLGGTVSRRLDIVEGLAASIPGSALPALEAHAAVVTVTPDLPVHVQGGADRTGGGGALRSVYADATRASRLVDDGVSGQGVTVALIDTGVADVRDLKGRVLRVTDPVTGAEAQCVDFSGEEDCDDSYGHGTFMAGIIAGDGAQSGGRWTGMAPAARIVSLKVAGRDGSSDVSKVLAAIQWVVSYRETYGIRVLNLSLGTDSTDPWDVDPFNYAVERAWDAGIVVTVAASNRGPAPGTIAKPGDDPWVLTVGAVDDRGTVPVADDRLPDFTSRGPTADGLEKPDVVAPGAHIVSLRAPGSAIDEAFPTYIDGAYRRGSGTSMATAVVSGGVALLLQRNPSWTPDDVKRELRASARRAASSDRMAVGAGEVDIAAAATTSGGALARPASHSSGRGSLDTSRGHVRVRADNPLGTVVDGLLTAQLMVADPIAFTTGNWDANTWRLSTWALHRWYGTTWYGTDWEGNNWHGNNWHGDWTGSTQQGQAAPSDSYGSPWKGAAWYGLWE